MAPQACVKSIRTEKDMAPQACVKSIPIVDYPSTDRLA